MMSVKRLIAKMKHHKRPASTPVVHKLACKKLKQQEDWPEWLDTKATQFDQYAQQGMFGYPIEPFTQAAIFHWVWVYKIKATDNIRKKARGVCDGSICGGTVQITGHTFASTHEMLNFCLFLAICAILHKFI